VAADVVGFAGLAFFYDFVQGAGVVFYKQPVADLVAFAVDRERFAFQSVEDHQRHQLFREVIGTVVVGAVGDQHRQAVGALPGSNQMIGAGFAGRVRAAGGVGRLFDKQVLCRVGCFAWVRQVAVDIVRADVMEAEVGFLFVFHRLPVVACGFQQGVGADDVGFDKLGRAIYGAVYVAFRGQVHDGIRLMLGQYAVDFGTVADVDLLKGEAFAVAHLCRAFQIAGVGELIQVNHVVLGVLDDVADDGGAYKAGAAGN